MVNKFSSLFTLNFKTRGMNTPVFVDGGMKSFIINEPPKSCCGWLYIAHCQPYRIIMLGSSVLLYIVM